VYLVLAEAKGLARNTSSMMMITRPDEVAEEDIRLPEGMTLHGTILSPDGLPFTSGGTVRVTYDRSVSDALQAYVDPIEVEVRPNGSFTIVDLGTGAVDLAVRCEPHPELRLEAVVASEEVLSVRLLALLPTEPAAPTVTPTDDAP